LPARVVLGRASLGILLGAMRLRLGRRRLALGLALRSLRRPEELRERALTHAGAPTRHRAPPWRGRGTCPQPPRSGRTSTPTSPSPEPPHTAQSCGSWSARRGLRNSPSGSRPPHASA